MENPGETVQGTLALAHPEITIHVRKIAIGIPMLLLELAALGGLLYAGRRVLPRCWNRLRGNGRPALGLAPVSDRPEETGRDLVISSVSLGLATSGAILGSRLLGVASLPGLLFVYVPTFGQAWQAVRRRRVDVDVLDAVRVAVCVVMGYWSIAALDALLQAADRRLLRRAERDFRTTLAEAFGKGEAKVWVYHEGIELETPVAAIGPGTIIVLATGDTAPAAGLVLAGRGFVRPALAAGPTLPTRQGDRLEAGGLVVSGRLHFLLEREPALAPLPHEILEQAAQGPTLLRQFGERSGERLAPWMLIAFALATPWLGVNRAAAFLTVRCGGQLRELSPHTARQAIAFGARHGILVRRVKALELAALVNTVVIDAAVLGDPVVRAEVSGVIHALRQRLWPAAQLMSRRFTVNVLAATEEEGLRLRETLGFDDYFTEPSPVNRATLFQSLQLGGRWLCYIGSGDADVLAMRTALVAVAHRPGEPLSGTAADIVLTDPVLRALPGLFDMATAFTERQGRNLIIPIGIDLIDLSASTFLQFGVVFSIVMSHAGMLTRLAGTGFPKAEPAPELEPPPTACPPALPDPFERTPDRPRT